MTKRPDRIFTLLSIGSNLGDKEDNISKALGLLTESGALTDIQVASLYETEPVGVTEQPWFVNTVLRAYTSEPLNQLLQLCKSIEYALGRTLRQRWHEREIDIDILLYGEMVVKSKMLTVPHPQMHNRKFVLVPADEIAGSLKHPGLGMTIHQLLTRCSDSSVVRFSR